MQIKKIGSVLAAIFLFITSPVIVSGDEGNQVSTGIKPYYTPGTEINNAIALRYKLRVNKNKANVQGKVMLVFSPKHFYTPGHPGTYVLEANLYNYWLSYSDTSCQGWPPIGQSFYGQSGLWVSVPDYHWEDLDITKRARVGVRQVDSETTQMFPRQSTGIDTISGGITKIETISQMDITGKDIEITYTRGGTFSAPLSGWGYRYRTNIHTGVIECVSDLPPDTYRMWIAEARIGKANYKWEFALPDESARYFYPNEISSFITEFFGHNSELFQIYLWDLQIQREDSTSWEALRRWEVFYSSDRAKVNRTHGQKLATYKGRTVIEISNDGTDTYYKYGDIFEIKEMGTLKVNVKGNGTVGSHDGLNCSGKCKKDYPFDSSVTLTAQPLPGYVFKKWSGNCVGTSSSCSIIMDAKKKSVTAKFQRSQ